jgi:hypothetical protein
MIHRSTALVTFVAFATIGGSFTVLSASQSQPQASGVSAAISQMLFLFLSTYFTVLPPLRGRTLHLRYPIWFWGCMVVSFLTSTLSPAVYYRFHAAATILSCVSRFSRVVYSLLLVECVEEAVKAGSIGGVLSYLQGDREVCRFFCGI